MGQNLTQRLHSNIAHDFNLTLILVEAYFSQIENYFLKHANLELSSGQMHYI